MAFRDEGSHRRGFRNRDSAQPERHGGQCPRRDRGARSAARRGDNGVVRRRVPGGHKRDENLGREIDWQVAMRPGRLTGRAVSEKRKASVRAKSLPPTAIGGGAPVPESEAGVWLRQEPALAKAGVRYRGLAKNTERLALLFGLGNLLTAEGQLTG